MQKIQKYTILELVIKTMRNLVSRWTSKIETLTLQQIQQSHKLGEEPFLQYISITTFYIHSI